MSAKSSSWVIGLYQFAAFSVYVYVVEAQHVDHRLGERLVPRGVVLADVVEVELDLFYRETFEGLEAVFDGELVFVELLELCVQVVLDVFEQRDEVDEGLPHVIFHVRKALLQLALEPLFQLQRLSLRVFVLLAQVLEVLD